MDVTWTRTIDAAIDPKKLAAAFDEEWKEFKRDNGADYGEFVLQSAEIMGADIFDGDWCTVKGESSEFDW